MEVSDEVGGMLQISGADPTELFGGAFVPVPAYIVAQRGGLIAPVDLAVEDVGDLVLFLVVDDDGRRRFLNAPGELVGDVRLELRDVENGVDCAEVVR